VAAGFLVAIAGVVIWLVWSLITGNPSVRRGSGAPGLPSGWPAGGGGFGGGGCDGGGSGGGGCGS
ncbi:hypothetical protein, partial [Streptosporangium sp. NPDC000396]|uniref:hypothetical protein n=1 Tax=Streptosporangium sp. NPDC000396 TaxID=3366185 RepID=UPI0036B6FA79